MVLTVKTTPQSRLLVSADWLATHSSQPDVKLVDVRSPNIYTDSHLPNALNLPLPALATVRDGVPEMLIDQPAFENRLGQLGLRETDTIVLYDGMWGLPAARALWALERYGHKSVHVLDGGFDAWQVEGRPLTNNSSATTARTIYHATPIDDRVATHDWLVAHLNDPDIVVVDTRTPNEYRAGHVPGAVNWDWMMSVPAGNSSPIRPPAELRTELASRGITPDREIVVYCRSGARSSHTYFTLRYLGYPRVRNYDGSWLAWSAKGLETTSRCQADSLRRNGDQYFDRPKGRAV